MIPRIAECRLELDAALAEHQPGSLSKALTFPAGNAIDCITTAGAGIAFRAAKVFVRRYLDDRADLVFKNRVPPYTMMRILICASAIDDGKTIDVHLYEIIALALRGAPRPGAVDRSGY